VNTPLWPVLVVVAALCPMLVTALVRALHGAKVEATRKALADIGPAPPPGSGGDGAGA
jgi:hypothetical protein